MFSIIASYVKETDMDALKRDVLAYLNRGNSFVGIHDKEQLGLLDILQKEDIQVLEQVDSWKEMIQTASAPLLSRGVIQNSYVQEMIHLVDEYGPYILLANSVAVAHAKPEHGAFRLGLSFLIVKRDVPFDEVSSLRYLFVLSDAAHDKHLNVLHEILQLSRNRDLLRRLDKCENAAAVRRLLHNDFS